ncbi:T9SS type A sorting domain-containing protein [Proteiniphilum sp. UBA5384]|uniref:T9SS type A sorting domain-containing protein n=1 Tax=Proteiniphilum sp. UBA5384 TaxID=1947279 RepID=UPI0025DFDD9D|nr:T9SS type A sorting domain-containing protein [Proteiniphilum sp. UBA5384]
MKRYGFLLLMCLAFGIGFSLFAQENPDTLVVEKQKEILTENNEKPKIKEERRNEGESQEKTKIKITGNQLIIEDLSQDGVLDIYNIMGAKVFNRRVKAGTNQYTLSLPRGYYIIKIGKITQKIAIK